MDTAFVRTGWLAGAVALCWIYVDARPATAAPRTWIGGNVDWVDNGSTANWSPADEPDIDDEAIFNTANTVNLGTNNSIIGLTLSNGIDLFTNDFDLTVDGLVQLTDSSTNLVVGGVNSLLIADSVTINSLANLELVGGSLQIIEETGSGLLDINAGGELVGHGTLSMADGVAAGTTLIINDGAITARRDPITIFGAPQVGTLSINATDIDTRIDLDGSGVGEDGVVNVTRNQTLDLNIPLSDLFAGTINLFHQATYDSLSGWGMNGGTINVDNGFVNNSPPNPDIPAGVSIIAGGQLGLTGGTINILDTDGTLQFNAVFETNAGNIVNNGRVIFNSNSIVAVGANLTMPTASSSLTVGPGAFVDILQANFNIDGANTLTNVITVEADGTLLISTTDYDPDQATNAFDGTITLNGGDIDVNISDAEFVMDGTLNMNSTSGHSAGWSGEPLDIGNDAGALDADMNVTGFLFSLAQIDSQIDFNSDADVNVASGGLLQFLSASTVNFDTVNGANHAEFTGTGRLEFNGTVNVNEAVTLNMVGGSIDLDGTDGQGNFINIDAPLVISAQSMLSFGKVNGGGGVNTLDVNSSTGTGVLTVNLDDPNDEWTLNAAGVMNLVNDNTAATLLAGSDVNLNGTVNVTGDVRVTARVDISGTVNIATAGQPLRLSGGDGLDVNTINGATINGPGLFGADTDKSLHGFGTINTDVDFEGTSILRADNGTLTIAGTILQVSTIGTDDGDGILNVVNAWNSNVASFVNLAGGELKGGAITVNNTSGITGIGLVSARVINNTRLLANGGGTLLFQTAANDNDWDGTGNTGELRAGVGMTLELRDVGAAFGFGGEVSAVAGGTVFANGFALDFNPGSTLSLQDGARYHSTSTTNIGGTVTIGAGDASTIEVQNNFFLTFETGSSTTLNANLRLVSNNANIDAGATFSGTGALIIPDDSHLVADPTANIGVLLDNQGTFRPSGINIVGRVDLKDYQQAATGELVIELAGIGLNQFDRVVIGGAALLTGSLDVDLEGGFVPALGNTFIFLTTIAGRSGTFSSYSLPSIGAVNSLAVTYGANNVTLQVIAGLWGDYSGNGVVDAADYVVWRKTLGAGVAAFSGADGSGNGLVDQADFEVWRSRFGAVLGAGAGSGAAVPEPAAAVMLIMAVAGLCLRRARSA